MNLYPENWKGQLASGLDRMGLVITPEQQRLLLDYLSLLMKWNRTYNLTAIRDPNEMVVRQLLDSLSILPLVRGERILDVGTGAGLPGIPLAICLPEARFTLIDANGKKTRFVQQVKMELGLMNLEVMQIRVEQFNPETGFEIITTRAFAALPKMVKQTQHLLVDGGTFLAMKGAVPNEELEALRMSGIETEIVKLNTPLPGERHAIILRFAESQLSDA